MPSAPSPRGQPPFPSNPTLRRAQAQWLFTPDELKRSPSVLDGLAMSAEHDNRAKGVNFITQVGIMLKLPQLTLGTAAVYLHRFFMRYSMVNLPNRPGMHHYAIAATAIFLATKVEESSRKMRDLIIACCRVAQKQPNLPVDEQSKEYWRWRDTILFNEDLLLEALCFDLQLEQPYRFLFDFLCYYNVQDNKLLRNAAWAFLNDSNLTVLCLMFPARTIAASAMYAGAKHTNTAFPDDEQGRAWWQHLGTDIKDIRRACNKMAEAYENTPLPRQGEKGAYVTTPEDGDEDAAKTRIKSTTNIHSVYSPAPSAGSEGGQGTKREREDRPEDETFRNGTSDGAQNGDQPRSPKRQRQSDSSEKTVQGETRPPPPPPPPPPSEPPTDDVQSRIDAIINANPASSSQPPPISRQNSQNQSWQHPPPRRRSRSPQSRLPPVDSYIGEAGRERRVTHGNERRQSWGSSQHSNGGGGGGARRPSYDSSRRGSYDKSRRDSYDRHRRGSGESGRDRYRADSREINGHRQGSEVAATAAVVEDEGNGSEEGEL